MNFGKLIDFFVKKLGMSEEDAVAAAAGAALGFTIDAVAFPGGMPPFTVTILSAVAGYTASRVLRNNPWYRRRTLENLDKLVARGHLTREQADYYKNKLIAKWLKSGHDIDGEAP